MRACGERAGLLDVVAVGQVGGVDHDRGDAEIGRGSERLVEQRGVLEVVQMHREGRTRLRGDACAGGDDRGDPAAVEVHRVLADLDQRGDPGALGALGDAFGVLDGDRVERQDRGALRDRRRDECRRWRPGSRWHLLSGGGRGEHHSSMRSSLKARNANRPNDQEN